MIDLTSHVLPRLKANKLPDLDLGIDQIHPAYGGLSILNLPASLCRWLGAPDLAHPALDLPSLDDLAHAAEQILVCLIDSVAFHRFRRWTERPAQGARTIIERSLMAPLTSVVPSTTSTALTTLWTGCGPAEHGMLGFELFLREHSLVANMISLSPVGFEGQSGMLYQAGFQPENALPVPTLGPSLAMSGVELHVVLPHEIRNSGLSRMHYSGFEIHGVRSTADLWIRVRELAESPAKGKRLICAYHSEIDRLSHIHGPDSEQAEAEFAALLWSLNENLMKRLSAESGRRSLLLLLSDHGQITTPKDTYYDLQSHPSLARRLLMQPTGESRLTYLYVRPGQAEAVAEYFGRTWPNAFRVLPSSHLLQAGLFGPGKPCAEAVYRLGDRIAVSQQDSYLWWAKKDNPLLGRHGGLSEEEMLVPLVACLLS